MWRWEMSLYDGLTRLGAHIVVKVKTVLNINSPMKWFVAGLLKTSHWTNLQSKKQIGNISLVNVFPSEIKSLSHSQME